MSEFTSKEKVVNGTKLYQVFIDGNPYGNPCGEEEANATIERLKQEEIRRKIDSDKSSENNAPSPKAPKTEKSKRTVVYDDSVQP